MSKRVLFLLDEHSLNEEYLRHLCEIAASYQEAIFVLKGADEFNKLNKTTGKLFVYLQGLIRLNLSIPFFLLPITLKGITGIGFWIRLKLLAPSFSIVYSHNASDQTPVELIFKCAFKKLHLPSKTLPDDFTDLDDKVQRGLFITRAQPFHLGHAAFVKQILNECDEVIVLIAVAEQSHSLKNPLSASERLEMLQDYLHAECPGKYYLLALPQNSFTLENMLELEYILPSFKAVYASNPILLSMCQTLDIPALGLREKIEVSASEIRNRIVEDKHYDSIIPEAIQNYLIKVKLSKRLKLLNQKERQ